MDHNSLWFRVKANDVPAVRMILENDSRDVNLRGGEIDPVAGRQVNPTTPLQVAAVDGNLEMASLLLCHGADVNVRVAYRAYTLLNYCVSHAWHHNRGKSVPMIELLLQNHANVESKSTTGSTPLNTAAEMCNFGKVTEILLKHGADVNTVNKEGYTPIMHSIRFGHEDQFDMLMKCGADIYMKNIDGHTVEDLAHIYSYTDSHRNIAAKLRRVIELRVTMQKCKVFAMGVKRPLNDKSPVTALPDAGVENIIAEVFSMYLTTQQE